MSISANIHPEGFEAQSNLERTVVWIRVGAGDGGYAAIFLTPELCDQLAEATATAKQLLNSGDDA